MRHSCLTCLAINKRQRFCHLCQSPYGSFTWETCMDMIRTGVGPCVVTLWQFPMVADSFTCTAVHVRQARFCKQQRSFGSLCMWKTLFKRTHTVHRAACSQSSNPHTSVGILPRAFTVHVLQQRVLVRLRAVLLLVLAAAHATTRAAARAFENKFTNCFF